MKGDYPSSKGGTSWKIKLKDKEKEANSISTK